MNPAFKEFLIQNYAPPKIDTIESIMEYFSHFEVPEVDMWVEQILLFVGEVELQELESKLFHLFTNTTRDIYLEAGIEIELTEIEQIPAFLEVYELVNNLGDDVYADGLFASDYSKEEQFSELMGYLTQQPVESFMPLIKEVEDSFIENFLNRDRGEDDMSEELEKERLELVPVVKDRLLNSGLPINASYVIELIKNALPLAMGIDTYVTLCHEKWSEMEFDELLNDIIIAVFASDTELADCKRTAISLINNYVDDPDKLTKAEIYYSKVLTGELKR